MIGRGKGRKDAADRDRRALAVEAARGRFVIEESREVVLVLDGEHRVLAASRRARQLIPELAIGTPAPPELLSGEAGWTALAASYELDGRREEILYLTESDGGSAYDELRTGFTAAVSHELRTPLARMLVLLESALLPGADYRRLVEQAQAEIEETRELIDDVLFLSELESGREVVALGSTEALPILKAVARDLSSRATTAGVAIDVQGDAALELPLRPRMLRVIAQNLAENAIRYAGLGATFTLSVRREHGRLVLTGSDDGAGVEEASVPRLFERFYRADHARSSRGTGLGLAIVKHIATAAGGTVDAEGGPGRGLRIELVFPG